MRRSLLAALALLPAAAATLSAQQATARDTYPEGEVVFRPSCFDSYEEEELRLSYGAPAGASAGGSVAAPALKQSRPKKSLKKPKSAATPSAPPPPPPAMAPAPLDALQGAGASRAYESTVELDDAAGMAEESTPFLMMPEPEPEPAKEMATEREEKKADRASRDADESGEDVAQAPRGSNLDWGATIFLSNDDSMSLASAQRLLYAVKNRVSFSVSEVRPHELLNYFSFDTAEPDADQVFDVLASAEQQGDTLEVALAVKGATPDPEPLDLTLVVDRSCSMESEGRMDYTKRGLRKMTDQLSAGDRVDVVLFDDTKCVPLENYVVGRDDPKLLTETIDRMKAEGGTDLDLGLKEGYRVAKSHRDTRHRNRRMMLLTDAMLNTGDVNPDTVSEIGKAYDGDGIRLTGVGVGRDFNDEVLDKLTEKGKGAYVYLGSEAVVDRVFGTGFDSLTRTIAHDVQFSLELPDSLAMERFYGEEASTNAADVQPIHYYAGTTQLFLQDLAIRDGRLALNDPLRMRIKYTDALTGEPAEEVLHTTIGALVDGDKHNLHKGQALMAFSDVAMSWAMGATPCGAPLTTYRQRIASLGTDAEIGYTSGLLGDLCGVDMSRTVPAGVAYKVKVDSDIPIAEVELACGGQRQAQAMGGADTVARFEAVTPGKCTVQLQGTMPMSAAVKVPSTGGDVRCIVRAGRLNCG